MQYLNSYFILNISGKEKKKRKQKNSTIKDIERVNYFAHNFSISHKVCLVEKKSDVDEAFTPLYGCECDV